MMKKTVIAGAFLLLLILIATAGCVFGLGGDGCGDTPCGSGASSGTDTAPVVAATPAPQQRELSELALSRGDMPFAVAEAMSEGKTLDAGSQSPGQTGAVRMYLTGFANGKKEAATQILLQTIMEIPPANVSESFDYAYRQITTGNSPGNTVRLLADPGIGDRSCAFTVTQGTSLEKTMTGIMFARANIIEIIMISAPGDNSALLTPLAEKAAALVPAGGTTSPGVKRTTVPVTFAPPETTVSRAPPEAPVGLLVWYDFEDDFTKTGYVTDRSGTGRNAAIIGTVAGGSGIRGTNGITFNGRGYILARDNPAAGHKEVAFSFWFRTSDPERNYKFASAAEWRGGPGTGWTMATHRPEFWADDGPEDLIVPAQPNAGNWFVPGQWTLETVVYDGKTMKEYTNGTLINTWQGRNIPMSIGVPMAVGGWPQFSAYNYVGQLDDFRIYDHALSAQEVAALYQEGRP